MTFEKIIKTIELGDNQCITKMIKIYELVE
jgi:hypothetical protein